MPDLGATAVIAIISALASAGEFAYSQVSKPGTPKPPTPEQLRQSNQLNPAQLANAVRQAKGDVQTQTSGSVAPDYLSQLIQSQYGSNAGNPGVVGQQSAQQWGGSFGTTSTTGPSSTGTTPSFGSGIPFGNASSGGLNTTGLATPSSGGFNISDWLQQLQQGGANA